MAKFDEAGIRPVAISVDSTEISLELSQRVGITFPILSDSKAEAIRKYDLLHSGAGINGQDIARPGEFLLDSTGTIRWVNLTENYWVRATPGQMLEAARALR